MRLRVSVDDRHVLKAFEVAGDLTTGILERLQQGAGEVLEETRHYPPPPANSKYVRTGRYFTSFQFTESPFRNGAKYTIASDAVDKLDIHYSSYVGGNNEQQLWFHARTGWRRLEEIAVRKAEKIIAEVRSELDSLAGKL